MKVRTYLAHTMDEAVDAVRRDLGSDAVILETRTIRRGGFLGFFARHVVELRAATPIEVRARRRKEPDAVQSPPVINRAQQAYSSTGAARNSSIEHELERSRTREMAKDLLVELQQGPTPEEPVPVITTPRDATEAPAADVVVRQELDEIRGLVERVLHVQRRNGGGQENLPFPDEVLGLYTELITQECSEELANEVLESVTGALDPQELGDPERVRRELVSRLSDFIPVAEGSLLSTSPDERPLTMALVGPTGVGKTTTVAKIAAAYRLRQGRSVGLVTLDTYRIAAVEQLRTYANIIGVPMHVARSTGELQETLDSMSDLDVVLIDTAGRSQKNTDRIEDLRRWLDIAQPHETHLVLASTASRAVLMNEAEEFGRIGIDRVVLTKLDEAVSFGMLVEVTHRIGKRLSFLTTGQEVPDHIETARSDRLAGLVLGAGAVS